MSTILLLAALLSGGDSGIFYDDVGGSCLPLSGGTITGNITFSGSLIGSNANGPSIVNRASTASVPTLLNNKSDDDTGIGGVAAAVTIVTNGTARMTATGGSVVRFPTGLYSSVDLNVDDGSATSTGGHQNFGTGSDFRMMYSTTQTPDSMMFGVSADSRGLVISEVADIGTDFAHALQTNPTIFIHSADATNTAQFGSLAHDQTDFVIDAGAGAIKFNDIARELVDARTIADDAAGTNAALTLTPTTSYVEINCADAQGCDVTMGETGMTAGMRVTICIVAQTAGATNFADTAGVTQLAGAFAANIDDCLSLRYGNTTTWREMGRSAN